MITKKEFDILAYLADVKEPSSQRAIAQATRMSVGSVNSTLSRLSESGYVEAGLITAKGLAMLEPFRVKRAVFIAAGFGSRLVPVTLNTPKPLVRVRGQRMIDSLLDAVVAIGIEEIYIVRGYLSEQFDQLLYKYPTIKFIENPAYNETNNISSALCAAYLLKNAYVFEADLVLCNKSLVTKYQYSSNYLGVPVEVTDDWCLFSERGRVTGVGLGGTNCHHMFGISYWNESDGARLSEHIKEVYQSPGGKERFWDQVALEYFIDEYDISIRECSFDDIVEIDTFRDLKALDKSYDV